MKNINLKGVNAETVTGVLILLVALVNAVLQMFGINTLPIENEEVTVKRIIKKEKYLILEAANPDVEPKIFTWEEVKTLPVQIIGKVIYARRDF